MADPGMPENDSPLKVRRYKYLDILTTMFSGSGCVCSVSNAW